MTVVDERPAPEVPVIGGVRLDEAAAEVLRAYGVFVKRRKVSTAEMRTTRAEYRRARRKFVELARTPLGIGMRPAVLARLVGVSRQTLLGWVAAVDVEDAER